MEQPWQRRLAVRVTKDAERHIRAGHPWVFDRSIESAKSGAAGDLAVIFDHNRKFLAIGLYDPSSPLAVRILHVGAPQTIDADWLTSTVARAAERRRPLLDRGDSDALRLVHGENDGLGGVVMDRYGANLVIKLYTAAWLPWLDHLVAAGLAVGSLDDGGIEGMGGIDRIVLRLSRQVATAADSRRDGEILAGPKLHGPVTFIENGLRFTADLIRGHKTGHFLDQRDNRSMIGSLASGREVLDIFACTGGFSVHAAAGGATAVTSVDLSGPALAAVQANMELNQPPINPALRHRIRVGDAFEIMEQMVAEDRGFDLVVVDPPSFAQRHSQVRRALTAYQRLASLAATLTRPGGLLFQASCSSRIDDAQLVDAVKQGVGSSDRRWTEIRRTGQPVDHPVSFPQGRYLKAVLLEAS